MEIPVKMSGSRIIVFSLFLSVLMGSCPAVGQEGKRIIVPLHINRDAIGIIGHEVEFDSNDAPASPGAIASLGHPRTGHAPGGILVRAERLADPPDVYRLTVLPQTDPTNVLASGVVAPGGQMVVEVPRSFGAGEQQKLP